MIELNNVSKIIKKNKVLDNINLKIENNKIYGFLGSNGSGKTMLFRAICGLIRPTTGEIKINNKILHKDMGIPESLGVIIETVGFWDNLTGFENLKLLSKIKNKINDSEIKSAITRVGLNSEDIRTYKKYSLGMKQRLAVAQAIMEKPKLLVLDEPTNALDEDGVELIRNIILQEKERGATVLIASHNKDDINLLSDKKFRVKDGRLTEMEGNIS
ncbi:multidrug ABC transporter ATP-binding protein [Bacillus halotolerans]|uniref:ATP-binding cassette domain-containing protein n=1 Tax=Bacillus halotolerans TaxID=260554 RepID=UPI000751156F|nr:ATP-binding cassette domain-containing protein [Bacillus halotolerans]KUP31965.1 multidrug ABC transporter ATP-binding protein [Bacillus halotolerans]